MDRQGSIMVVDDDAQVRKLIVSYLGVMNLGKEIQDFELPEEGMAEIGRTKIDLLVVDEYFPESAYTGMDLVQEVKLCQPDAGVIMIAGCAPDIGSPQMRERGVEVFLSKPLNYAAFKVHVVRILTSRPELSFGHER